MQKMSAMTADNDQKISDMEIMIAHQDRQIQELNDIVAKQWEEIDALKIYMRATKSKLEVLENNLSDEEKGMSVSDIAEQNKPPHY